MRVLQRAGFLVAVLCPLLAAAPVLMSQTAHSELTGTPVYEKDARFQAVANDPAARALDLDAERQALEQRLREIVEELEEAARAREQLMEQPSLIDPASIETTPMATHPFEEARKTCPQKQKAAHAG